MELRQSPLSLPERMQADAQVAELASSEYRQAKYGLLETTVAAIEENSSLKSWHPDNWNWQQQYEPVPTDFDPLQYVPKEMYTNGQLDNAWDEIFTARNQAEVQSVLANANASARRKDIIANGSGWGQFWGTTIGLLSSPEYWPGLLYNPTGGIVRTAIELGVIGAAETAFHEFNMQRQQVNRDPYESLANVGTAALFSAALGGVIGKFVRKGDKELHNTFLGARAEIEREINDIARNQGLRDLNDVVDEIPVLNPLDDGLRSAGAREAGMGEGAEPIRGLRWGSGYISALRPLVKARVTEVHDLLNRYFGHDLQIKANAREVEVWDAAQGKMVKTGQIEHVAKPTSLARQVDRESHRMLVQGERAIREGFLDYVQHKGKSLTIARIKNLGRWEEYNQKLRWAQSNNDQALDPADIAVTTAAKKLREAVYAPIERAARRLELLDKDAREGLKNNLKKIGDQLRKASDPAEIKRLEQELERAQKALDDFEFKTGDVKFADSYSNRRLHRVNIERDVAKFKQMLTKRYKEIRTQTAFDEFKAKLQDRVLDRTTKIAKRTAMLTKKGLDPAKIAKDKTIRRYEREIAEANQKIATADITKFARTDAEFLAEIQENVDATYQRVVNGELSGEVWEKGAHSPKVFRERQLPLTDNELLDNDWLHTDMLDQIRAYINTTLRPIRMKEVAGDLEMQTELDAVAAAYQRKMNEALAKGDKALHDSLGKERTLNIEALEKVRDRYYGRSHRYEGRAATVANIFRAIRNLNVMRMMGGVLFTSLNDLTRLNAARIYVQALHGKGPGLWSAWQTLRNGTTLEDLKAIGAAAETLSMARMTKYVDLGVPILAGGHKSKAFLNLTAKGAKGLMKATLLTQWTDGMKLMAAALTQNQVVLMMRNYAKLTTKERTILAEMGIDERLAKDVMAQFDQFGDRFGKYGTSLNWDDWTDQAAAERMKDVLFRQSERILVTPRETDLPLVLADSELGRAFLQFKSFSLAAHNQTTVPLLERAQTGDLMSIYAMATMAVGAVPLEMLKMLEAGRENELKDYSAMDWGLAIVDRSALMPMLSMGFNTVDMALGNRITKEFGAQPVSRYSDRNITGSLGPTASTIGDLLRLTSSLAGDELDMRDLQAIKRLAPFQNYVILNRLANEALGKGKTKTTYSEK